MKIGSLTRPHQILAPLRTAASLLLALGFVIGTGTARPVSAQTANFLLNGSFEGGYHKQAGIPELAVPNFWRLYYVDNATFAGIYPGQIAYRPETVVWNKAQAPDDERALFWRDGDYTLKIFKPWAPLYAALAQDVAGLQPGADYTFTAYIFVDVVASYSGASKVPPPADAEHNDDVQLRLGASRVGAAWRDASAINYTPWVNAANRTPFHQSTVVLTYTFRAVASQMTVWVEMMSTAAYTNNGFFLDALSLTRPGVPPGLPADGTPAPAATAAFNAPPGAGTYTVRPGDTIYGIARKFQVPSAAIIAANHLANPRLIHAGQALIIPDPTKFYTVQRGDTLSVIAQKLNTIVTTLQALNSLTGKFIYTGQVLVVP